MTPINLNQAPGVLAFEQRYAHNAGITVEMLHSWGRFGETCDCGEDGCEGYRIGHQWEEALFENWVRTGERL